MPIISLHGAGKTYTTPAGPIVALQPATMEVQVGELTLLVGPSGSGKTTLLSLMGCLINPTEGEVWIKGKRTNDLSAREMADIRLNTMGFVFQQFNLLAPLTAEQNIAFPLQIQKRPERELKEKTMQALEKVHMTHRRKSLPKQLSGGEQQRIAIARALVTEPEIILCDEPTASLDKDSFSIVMEELAGLARDGKAVVVVTHDARLQKYARRAVEVKNGLVVPMEINKVFEGHGNA